MVKIIDDRWQKREKEEESNRYYFHRSKHIIPTSVTETSYSNLVEDVMRLFADKIPSTPSPTPNISVIKFQKDILING